MRWVFILRCFHYYSFLTLVSQVTQASIRSQSNLSKVVAIKRLQVGPLIKSSVSEKLESVGGMNFPFSVNVSKHLFGRYFIIQATIVNIGASVVSDISLNITECSDDCLSPIEHVSIKSLPPSSSSSSYAILNRVDRAVGKAQRGRSPSRSEATSREFSI